MVALKNGRLVLAPIYDAVKELRTVNIEQSYDTKNYRAKFRMLGMLSPLEEKS
jgi:hypothetical protein